MILLKDFYAKQLLRKAILIPKGEVVTTSEEAMKIQASLNKPLLIKPIGNFAKPKVIKAGNTSDVIAAVHQLLSSEKDEFATDAVLIEEELTKKGELFLGFAIDEITHLPQITFTAATDKVNRENWTEEQLDIVQFHVNLNNSLLDFEARNIARKSKIGIELVSAMGKFISSFYNFCIEYNIVKGKIDPLVVTENFEIIAENCELWLDKHKIDFLNENLKFANDFKINNFSRTLTSDEQFVLTLPENREKTSSLEFRELTQPILDEQKPIALICMDGIAEARFIHDAIINENLAVRSLCMLNGNIHSSSVYRFFNRLLASENYSGIFVSGFGYSSISQPVIARGILKSFRKSNLSIPVVIRFDSLYEEEAIDIIRNNCWDLPAMVEPYGSDNSLNFCVKRLKLLIDEQKIRKIRVDPLGNNQEFLQPFSFKTKTGTIKFDYDKCEQCENHICTKGCPENILKIDRKHVMLTISGKFAENWGCTECLACEFLCWSQSKNAITFQLP